MNSLRRFLLSVPFASLIFVFAGCAALRGNEKRYPIQGTVIAVNTTDKTATIKHRDIPGYMPGMTMEFKVKGDADLQVMKPGDAITGTLVVDDASSWIEITTITEGGAQITPTSIVPGEPKPGDAVPDFELMNQDGKRIHLAQYRGLALALTFVYTRCLQPDQCTLMSNNFAEIDRELQKQTNVYAKTHLLTISFDPDYDTPKVMRSYGASHTGRYSDETFQHWEFATGTAEQIKTMAQFFGLRYFHDTESDQDQVIHSLRTAVIDPNGKLIKLYRGNEWRPSEIADDLKALASNTR